MSRRELYGKVIFWAFFGIIALQTAILGATYLIFAVNNFNLMHQTLIVLIFVGLVASSVTILVVLALRWLMTHQSAHGINRSEKDYNMISALYDAIDQNALSIYYQPLIELKTSKVIGMEALVRWIHIDRGFIAPNDFIHLAEETGLIIPISEWMLKSACMQTKDWLDQGFNLRVAVNISTRLFKETDLVATISQVLKESNLPPQNLELEITESAMIEEMDRAIALMYKLRDLGVCLSMDDFGTGYSCLSSLDRFPIHKIKIDQVFVHSINQYDSEPNIADSIIYMAHSLKLQTIAEGIETDYQREYLTKLRCDAGQGYLFGQPMPANEFVQFLKN